MDWVGPSFLDGTCSSCFFLERCCLIKLIFTFFFSGLGYPKPFGLILIHSLLKKKFLIIFRLIWFWRCYWAIIRDTREYGITKFLLLCNRFLSWFCLFDLLVCITWFIFLLIENYLIVILCSVFIRQLPQWMMGVAMQAPMGYGYVSLKDTFLRSVFFFFQFSTMQVFSLVGASCGSDAYLLLKYLHQFILTSLGWNFFYRIHEISVQLEVSKVNLVRFAR